MNRTSRLKAMSKVFTTLLTVLAGALMVVTAKGLPWAAIDYCPWSLVGFFCGFGKLTDQGSIIVFMIIGTIIIAI